MMELGGLHFVGVLCCCVVFGGARGGSGRFGNLVG